MVFATCLPFTKGSIYRLASGNLRSGNVLDCLVIILFGIGTVVGVLLSSFFWKLVYKH